MEVQEINNLNRISVSRYNKSIIRYKKTILEEYNLDKIGTIRYAKIHASANRPLRKIEGKEFNKGTQFCKCCNLPAEQEGILEKFTFCENPDEFVECGEGVSLYFTFFKFAIIVMFTTFALSSICNIIFASYYTEELRSICDDYFNNFPNDEKFEKDCKIFLNEQENNSKYSTEVKIFFFNFNIVNTKNYRSLYYNIMKEKNKNIDKIIINTSLINFLGLITLFILNLIFILLVYFKSKKVDISVLSPSDYSVFISNLYDVHKKFLIIKKEIEEKYNKITEIYEYKKELEDRLGIDKSLEKPTELQEFECFLKNKICIIKDTQFNIEKVNICFKISDLMNKEKELQKISESIDKLKNHPYQILKNEQLGLEGENMNYFSSFWESFDCHCCEKSTPLIELEKEKNKLKNEIDKLMENSKKNTRQFFGGCAIISFDTIKEHENFLSYHRNNIIIYLKKFFKDFIYVFCGCCINKKDIYWLKRDVIFERAPEPEDIIYENLEYNNSVVKIIRLIFVYFISIILIVISLIIVTALNYLQKYCDDKNYSIVVAYIISFLITCSIQIINIGFKFFLDFLTKKEKQFTTTNYYLSYSLKLTLFSFINSGIVPYFSELYNGTEGYQYLITNIFMILLVNGFLTPISWTMNPSFFIKKFKIWLVEKKEDSDFGHGKTQRELNELYELPSMGISAKYSYIFKTLLISNFYISIFPFGVLICFLGFIFGYFIEKFNFCKMYKRPEVLNDEICKFYINYFITVLFVNGIGDFIFKKDIYNSNTWSLVNIIVFGALIPIPYHDFITRDFLGLKESKIHSMGLKDVELTFFTDYERANPMTKKEGITHYLKGLREKKMISEDTYNKGVENLENINLMKLYYKDRKQQNTLKTQKTLLSKSTKKQKNSLIYVKTITNKDLNEINLEDLIIDEDKDDNKGFLPSINTKNSNINDYTGRTQNKKISSERKLVVRGNFLKTNN